MNVEINIEKLIDYSITIEQVLFCQFVYQQQQSLFDTYLSLYGKFFTRESLDSLVDEGYLQLKDETMGYRFGNLKVTPRFVSAFVTIPITNRTKEDKPENWINSWYELFPKGVKNGNYLVRSGKSGCLAKMKKFIKEYPEYTTEVIMQATKEYVAHCRINRWAYMQLAHYFIYKDGMSNLAAQCENVVYRLETSRGVGKEVEEGIVEVDNIDDI